MCGCIDGPTDLAPRFTFLSRKFRIGAVAAAKAGMEKSLRRFTLRRSHKPQPSELYPQYAALFRRMDSDNSGELSLEEIRTALVKDEDFARAAGAPTTLTRLAATAVAANIIDGADDSESVAINEFVAWLVLCNGQAQDALLEKAASAAAASGSGARDRVAYLPGHSKRAERRATWAADETRWEAVRQMLREDVLSRADTCVAEPPPPYCTAGYAYQPPACCSTGGAGQLAPGGGRHCCNVRCVPYVPRAVRTACRGSAGAQP